MGRGAVDAVQLEQAVFALPALFHAKGYLTADVKSKAIRDEATCTVVYQMQMTPGDLFTLGKLEIAGLDDAHVRSIEKLCRLRTESLTGIPAVCVDEGARHERAFVRQ